jgi:hypothetical protein
VSRDRTHASESSSLSTDVCPKASLGHTVAIFAHQFEGDLRRHKGHMVVVVVMLEKGK